MRFALRAALAAVLGTVAVGSAAANDGVAEFGAGGLVQLSKEPRVAMARERLLVSLARIRVEYEFVNESAEEVVTEVAFPIPPYDLDRLTRWSDVAPAYDAFSFLDWKGTADGVPLRFQKQVRALVGDRDVTDALTAAGIDFERFGGHDAHDAPDYVVRRLPEQVRARLRRLGALDPQLDDHPRWRVAITYHWTQRFPPGRPVRVVHEYRPITGASSSLGSVESFRTTFPRGCLDARTAARITGSKAWKQGDRPGFASLQYILTTANTWKQPIRDFELVVERDARDVVTFCWDGDVKADGKTRLVARVKDFVPRRELDVYFIRTGE